MKLREYIRNTYVALSGITIAQIPGNMPSLYGTVPVQKTFFDWVIMAFWWLILPLAILIAIIFGIVALVKKRKNNDKKDSQSGPTQGVGKL